MTRRMFLISNSIYELPFGKGKRFFADTGSWRSAGGRLAVNAIVRLSSGGALHVRRSPLDLQHNWTLDQAAGNFQT